MFDTNREQFFMNRRKFISNVGLGVGVVAASPYLFNNILMSNSASTSALGENLISTNFGLSLEEIKRLLTIALSKGGDFSELYFEYNRNGSVFMEESLIKSTSENLSFMPGE